MDQGNITIEQGYAAMYYFLEKLQAMTNSDDLAGFLGSMSLLADGKPADAALWSDWIEAINKAQNNTNEDLYLRLQK